MDRAYFPARVERVPQDVINWDGEILDNSWRNLGEILADFRQISSLQQGSGGVGEVRPRLRTKAKDKAKGKAKAKAIIDGHASPHEWGRWTCLFD